MGYAEHFPFVVDSEASEIYVELKQGISEALPNSARVTFSEIGNIRLAADAFTHESRWARKACKRFRTRQVLGFRFRF